MEAVVMDCNEKNVVVMKKDGTFLTIPNASYSIGERIELAEVKRPWAKQLLAAACLCLVIGLGAVGAGLWFAPYSHVGVSAEYSVDFTLNRFEYVIDVQVKSDDHKLLTEEFSKEMENKKVVDAVAETIEKSENAAATQVTVSSKKENEQKKLQDKLERQTNAGVVQEDAERQNGVQNQLPQKEVEKSQVHADRKTLTGTLLMEDEKTAQEKQENMADGTAAVEKSEAVCDESADEAKKSEGISDDVSFEEADEEILGDVSFEETSEGISGDVSSEEVAVGTSDEVSDEKLSDEAAADGTEEASGNADKAELSGEEADNISEAQKNDESAAELSDEMLDNTDEALAEKLD